jgi:hypothetical protein
VFRAFDDPNLSEYRVQMESSERVKMLEKKDIERVA